MNLPAFHPPICLWLGATRTAYLSLASAPVDAPMLTVSGPSLLVDQVAQGIAAASKPSGPWRARVTTSVDPALMFPSPEHYATVRKALAEIHSWLVTGAIAPVEDLAQSFPRMEEIAQGALQSTPEAAP
jgi:hypothetical protein